MSIREKHTDKMEEILEKEMYADEGFSEIDEEDQRPETQKVMKQERRQQRKNRRKNWKLRNKIAIVLSLIVSVIAIGYVGTAVFYSTHFFSKTVINGIDCSNKNVKQVEEYLEKEVADYKLTLLEADNKTEVIEGKDISLKYVPGKQVEKLIKGQNPFLWIESLWKGRNMKAKIGVEYDESALKTQIANLECMKEENQIAPVNAHPEFKTDKFVVVPETDGTTIKTEEFRKAVITAVNGANEKLDLLKTGCYEKPAYTSDSKKVTEACDAMNKYLGATVTYDFKPNTEVVDSSMISKWVKVDDDMNVTFDESAVKEYVQSLAAKYDTKGKKRTFTSASGNTVTVSGGSYGWKIDQEAETANLIKVIKQGKSVKRKPEYAHRAKSRKKFDIGNTYVEVSLGEQHMWFYKNGKTLVSTDVVTGDISKGHGTPTGVYYILYKTTDYTLTGQGYASHVDYWLPFIQIGVGIHDSSWRGSYGGGIFTYDGSHGCVNTPRSAVQKIYNNIESTYPVVVHW